MRTTQLRRTDLDGGTEHTGGLVDLSEVPRELLADWSTTRYTAEEWVVTISYPVVAPKDVVYKIVVTNPTTGFHWEGELDADRRL